MFLERDKLYQDVEGNIWRVVCTDYSDAFGPCIAVVESSKPGLFPDDWSHQYMPGGMCATDKRGFVDYGKYRHDLISEYRKPREWDIYVSNGGNSITYVPNGVCEKVRVREII